MKFVIKTQGNVQNLMRRLGYYFERIKGDEMVFVRTLGTSRSGYPRFHIYLCVSRRASEAVINLHLDQKKPSYGGATAHSGEYEGELVKREAERIKELLK